MARARSGILQFSLGPLSLFKQTSITSNNVAGQQPKIGFAVGREVGCWVGQVVGAFEAMHECNTQSGFCSPPLVFLHNFSFTFGTVHTGAGAGVGERVVGGEVGCGYTSECDAGDLLRLRLMFPL